MHKAQLIDRSFINGIRYKRRAFKYSYNDMKMIIYILPFITFSSCDIVTQFIKNKWEFNRL